jgi:octaprenyl-diphosphate synthase
LARATCEAVPEAGSYNRSASEARFVPSTNDTIDAATDPLDLSLQRVDEVIRARLSSSVALIDQISTYIVGAGGKRIRPRLVLLFAEALGFEGPERYELAAVVEFIHTATLLHDDVVDESSLRRGRATANAMFGNAASVLVGDFLYSRAFQMMVSVDRMRVLEVLAEATNVIAEGEVLQLMNMHDPDLEVEDYLRVIRFKTAKLFEASARLGAVLARTDRATEEPARLRSRAGHRLPARRRPARLRRQHAEQLGKNVGDDLREGKPTLPLLLAMNRGTVEQRQIRVGRSRTARWSACRTSSRSSRPPARSMPRARPPAGRPTRPGSAWRRCRPRRLATLC